MGEKWSKFRLLMRKNWWLLRYQPIFTILRVLSPALFSVLLILLKIYIVEREYRSSVTYYPFCTTPVLYDFVDVMCQKEYQGGFSIVYSPDSEAIEKIMDGFYLVFHEIIPLANSKELENYLKIEATDSTLFAIEFEDKYEELSDLDELNQFKVSIRMQGDLKFYVTHMTMTSWNTFLTYPIRQMPGPRFSEWPTGGLPGYFREGFSAIQHLLTLFVIVAKSTNASVSSIHPWPLEIGPPPPLISMRRYPYPAWTEDSIHFGLHLIVSLFISISFFPIYQYIVNVIVIEKETQLKETMKIMGIPSWLHWAAWFVEYFLICFVALLLDVILLMAIPQIKMFDKTSPSVVIVLAVFYICAMITFAFLISVLCSKSTTSVLVGSFGFGVTLLPILFTIQAYFHNRYSSNVWKIISSVLFSSAFAFGIDVIFGFEANDEAMHWKYLFKTSGPDKILSVGLVMVMLIFDTLLYLIIALYVDAVFPGEYGIPKKWNFIFKSNFWCCRPEKEDETATENYSNSGEFFEPEPRNLRPGIVISKLSKVFKKKIAVRELTLNMYQGQITVLLGHNGAGKTTTISMLTGMRRPTKGTARINGYDIQTRQKEARQSLGLCPQHNIIFNQLTVGQHFYFFGRLKGLSAAQIKSEVDKYLGLLGLVDKKNAYAATLSGGMKRTLCIGLALCGNSKVVLLDEPTCSLDPSARRNLWTLLQNEKKDRTILMSTHLMEEADILGDRIAIMAAGNLKCCGSPFFLKKKYGTGSTLIIEKSANCNVQAVTQLLRNYIGKVEIQSNVGSELVYSLPSDASKYFEPMLRDLELSKSKLGVLGYGISLTTMEEVFMKVGAEHGNETEDSPDSNRPTNRQQRRTASTNPSFKVGLGLVCNQYKAMFLKKILATSRNWIFYIAHIIMACLIVIWGLTDTSGMTDNQPAMPLDLKKFHKPVVMVEKTSTNDFYDSYLKILGDHKYDYEKSSNISNRMLSLSKAQPAVVRTQYIVGASFHEDNHITAWFNNDPLHSPGISLALVLNAVLKKMLQCPDCFIEFINHPMPYNAREKAQQVKYGRSKGNELAQCLMFGLAFAASFFIIYVIKENVSKFKHLQYASGVDPFIFWSATLLWDMLMYIILISAVVITIVCFQVEGFKSADDIGRLYLILFYYGWAVLPLMYLLAYIFKNAASGYNFGLLLFLPALVGLTFIQLSFIFKKLVEPMKTVNKILIIIPNYSMVIGIIHSNILYMFKMMCAKCMNGICHPHHVAYAETCKDVEKSYYRLSYPGIGLCLIFSFLEGVIFFLLVLWIDYRCCSIGIGNWSRFKHDKPHDSSDDGDSDVEKERNKITQANRQRLLQNNTLVLFNLTKYYGKKLAVNSLCLGVRDYECFGLLGVNGAGKTTTFRMLTGDLRISSGDAWIKACSAKNQRRKVHQYIGYCPQFDALFESFTVKETIVIFGLIRGIRCRDCDELVNRLATDLNFQVHLKKKVRNLSGGNKRKLSTAISLIGDPSAVFLDEPTAGLDPEARRFVWNALCKIRDSGKCVILTSHSMEECEALCTKLAIMVNGEFQCLGSVQHLKGKFAATYTLNIKVKRAAVGSAGSTKKVEDFVKRTFPNAKLIEKRQELLTYFITDVYADLLPVSQMFGVMERSKDMNLDIEDYSIGQTSLEQVFLTFAKKQRQF